MNYNNISISNNLYKNCAVKNVSDFLSVKEVSANGVCRTMKKEDVVQMADSSPKGSFAEQLKTCRENIVDDIRKQASIQKKEQIKQEVVSGTYQIDCSAIAKKMITAELDFKI